jgi:hypothetical protein
MGEPKSIGEVISWPILRVKRAMRAKNRLLQADADIQGACENLFEYVNGITDPEKSKLIQTVRINGIEIGYRRRSFHTFRRREVFIKVPGYRIEDLSKGEKERIVTAVFNVFLVPGAALPELSRPAKDCMVMRQDYIPMIPIERSPGLVSIAGGWGGANA